MGYLTLANAWEVWVLVSGGGKEAALRESISAWGKTPLARLLRMRPNTHVLSSVPLAAQ
jgi:6-phosphogluconolactonase/glucosamine-6-phosphate isomerase/deaminase